MSTSGIVEPSACTWCSIARREHGRQYADAVGWHEWEQPPQEQILARMKARRLQLAVARAGALPMPVGGERTLDVVEEELAGVHLALWSEVQAYARLRLASAVTVPFVLWVDADYLLIEDWQPVRDRLLVEATNARHTAVEARRRLAVTAAGLLLLLSAPTSGVNS